MISIIVPVYNAASYVSHTIDNLLQQDVEKEIILVNDGSTDESLSIINSYAKIHPCIRVIDKPNGGVSSARNVGIDVAIGENLMFVDSDDILMDGALAEVTKHLTPEIETVFFSYQHVNDNLQSLSTIQYLPTGSYSLADWISDFEHLMSTHIISCIGTKVYCSRIIKEYNIRFNQQMSHYEDISFAFEYLQHIDCLYFINEPYYKYVHLNKQSLFGRYCNNMIYAADFCFNNVNKIIGAKKSQFYAVELVADCIDNEITRSGVSIEEKAKRLSNLRNSLIFHNYKGPTSNKLYATLIIKNLFYLLVIVASTNALLRKYIAFAQSYQSLIRRRIHGKN